MLIYREEFCGKVAQIKMKELVYYIEDQENQRSNAEQQFYKNGNIIIAH